MIIKILQYKSLPWQEGENQPKKKQTKTKKTSLVQTAGGDPLRFQLLEPASVLKPSCAAASQTQSSLEEEGRRGVLQVGGWGRVRDRTGRVPLDALAALHLWFILSRLHLDGHHIVAW